jgi:hypothetical protein
MSIERNVNVAKEGDVCLYGESPNDLRSLRFL